MLLATPFLTCNYRYCFSQGGGSRTKPCFRPSTLYSSLSPSSRSSIVKLLTSVVMLLTSVVKLLTSFVRLLSSIVKLPRQSRS